MDIERILGGILDSLPRNIVDKMHSALVHLPLSWLVEQVDGGADGVTDEDRANLQPGDELWRFRSPEQTWRSLSGREGIAILRGGAVVYARCYSVS